MGGFDAGRVIVTGFSPFPFEEGRHSRVERVHRITRVPIDRHAVKGKNLIEIIGQMPGIDRLSDRRQKRNELPVAPAQGVEVLAQE